jgi:stage IV sporulation protein FB
MLFLGVMLFASARQEQNNASYVFMRYLSSRKQELRLRRVFAVKNIAATVESSLGEVLRSFQPPCYHMIWVLDLEGRVTGVLGELELISLLFEHGLAFKIGAAAPHKFS